MNKRHRALLVGIPLMLVGAVLSLVPILYVGGKAYTRFHNLLSKGKGGSTFLLGVFVKWPSGTTMTNTEILTMGIIGVLMLYLGARQLRER